MILFLVGFSSGLTDVFYRLVVMSLLGASSKVLSLNKIHQNELN